MSVRGRVWFERIAGNAPLVPELPASVLAADVRMNQRLVRAVAVVPDPHARFARARNGEVGIDEGYGLAKAVLEAQTAGILAIVDVPGQAFGLQEEGLGLQRALGAAVEAYASKRRGGVPVAALIVGKAISGAFLAHGMQAGWIGALRDPGIEVHVMSQAATARVTRMAPDEIARLANEIPATAREIERFASFGAIDELFDVTDPDDPSPRDVDTVVKAIARVFDDPVLGLRNPVERLQSERARTTRALARDVRAQIDEQWNA